MKQSNDIVLRWKKFRKEIQPAWEKTKKFSKEAFAWLCVAWKNIVRLRKVIAAVPVGVGAIILAINNLSKLPDSVGINIQSDGTFSVLVARELAVLGPIAITAICLLLMFSSKRILTPWLVSLFSLAIPLLLLITNVFPA